MAFVFGYGSLVDGPEAQIECRLDGYRRRWTVAMDNSVDLPGYKYFVDPDTGERPHVFVTFLNIEPDASSAVNGIAVPVSDATLAELELRERNYSRCDVTAMMREDIGGQVYAFVGRRDALQRFASGSREGRAVISLAYYEQVLKGFGRRGEAALEEFKRSTDEPACPVIPLTRVDLP
ncbi:MAG: gamma-glutamylcyclotransferase [Actinomycetota bacterium]|nr:gamma-glutamylcyclotransferase [Actinomycetota bacterium]